MARRFPARRRAELLSRIHWLPALSAREYLSLLSHASLVLDSYPVGNPVGALEAFAVGTPVVTLPFMQRHGFRYAADMWTAVAARASGASALGGHFAVGSAQREMLPIAGDVDDFVATTIALLSDAPRLAALREVIRAGRSALFDDSEYAEDFARFLWAVGGQFTGSAPLAAESVSE